MHLRISSPPVTDPCFYGMDFPSKEELFANQVPAPAPPKTPKPTRSRKLHTHLGAFKVAVSARVALLSRVAPLVSSSRAFPHESASRGSTATTRSSPARRAGRHTQEPPPRRALAGSAC